VISSFSTPPAGTSRGEGEPERRVRVEPGDAKFDVRPQETVIEAAWRAGYQWPTTCWGQAECGVCAMEVLEGAELLGPIGEAEATRLRALPRRVGSRRLACQTRLAGSGSVTVRKPGVRRRENEGPAAAS
jgi:2Fe-2S ferredoxin